MNNALKACLVAFVAAVSIGASVTGCAKTYTQPELVASTPTAAIGLDDKLNRARDMIVGAWVRGGW